MAKLSPRPGKVGREVRTAVKSLGELDGLAKIDAVVAERTADVVDGAYRADDPRLVLAALRDLRTAVGRLRSEPADGASGDDGGAGGDAAGDPMAGVLGSGPTVGDAADS